MALNTLSSRREEIQRWLEAHHDLDDKWETYATTIRGIFTDYVEIGRETV
jgi:hypothetical protein